MTRISLPETSHHLISAKLKPGDIAIDATLGNGHDTLFLAQHVGLDGGVYGFDVQAQALKSTKQRLSDAGLLECVTLFQVCHAEMGDYIPTQHHGRIQAIMFNLGYLPGSDKTVITHTESTLAALNIACKLLAPGGVLSILAYPGHAGGDQETSAVQNWLEELNPEHFKCTTHFSNVHKAKAPRLYHIEKQQ